MIMEGKAVEGTVKGLVEGTEVVSLPIGVM